MGFFSFSYTENRNDGTMIISFPSMFKKVIFHLDDVLCFLMQTQQDDSFLWSHDPSNDLQKVSTKWRRFPTGLDGLTIALRLRSPFATLETFMSSLYPHP